MITDRDFKVKKWDPKFLLHSLKHAIVHYLGATLTQLTHKGVPFSNVKTVKKKIGYPGSVALGLADFQWASAGNMTAQNIDLGAIVPALARVLDVKIHTEQTHTGAVSLALTAGNASAGSQFVVTGASYTLNDVRAIAAATDFTEAPAAAASKVFIGGTPGANWSLMTAGRVAIYVTYIEI